MQSILLKIFTHSHPGYTTYKFSSMINVGLVLLNIKLGAIEEIDEKIYYLLRKYGLYVEKYPYLNKKSLVFISKKDPKFGVPINHIEIGKKLGYLTPQNLNEDYYYKKKYNVHIKIKFRNNNGKILTTSILNQIVIDKSMSSIKSYLKKYKDGIHKLTIPTQFKIIEISDYIEEWTNK